MTFGGIMIGLLIAYAFGWPEHFGSKLARIIGTVRDTLRERQP